MYLGTDVEKGRASPQRGLQELEPCILDREDSWEPRCGTCTGSVSNERRISGILEKGSTKSTQTRRYVICEIESCDAYKSFWN